MRDWLSERPETVNCSEMKGSMIDAKLAFLLL